MNRKTKIIVSVVGIIIVTLALLGITYAYYLTRIQGNTNTNSISLTTAKLELVYGDNSEEIITTRGALVPKLGTETSDAIGTKTFTVTNNGNDSSYVVVIDNVRITEASDGTTTTFISNDFRYKLSCYKSDGTKCNEVNKIKILPINGGALIENNITPGDIHTYTLTLWYIDTGVDQSNDMGKSLQARVNILESDSSKAYQLAEKIYQEYKTGVNLGTIPSTTPATQYIRNELYKLNIYSNDISIYNDRLIIGSGSYALEAGIEIGDCIEYNSPVEIVEAKKDDKCEWRVLNIDDDGNLQILSHDAKMMRLSSYEEGIKELNEASKGYADGIVGINARSLTVEDVNKITGYNPINVGVYDPMQTGKGIKYGQGTLREYLNEVTFTQGSSILTITGANNTTTTTTNKYYPYLSNTALTNGESDTVIRDYYSYYPETLTSDTYIDGNPVIGISKTSKVWDMLFSPIINPEEPSNFYWLANTYIDAKATEAHWGMRVIGGGRVTGAALWVSKSGNENIYLYFLRVVVTIQNIKGMSFEKTNYQSHGETNYVINV